MKIGVDARPLLYPTTGIGRYTAELLSRLTNTGHDWFVYSDRPITAWSSRDRVSMRSAGNSLSAASSLYSQALYPGWAHDDQIDVFWSPRHHLPLRLNKKVKTVVTIHDMVWKHAGNTMRPLGRAIERLLMPPSIARADRILAPSLSTRADIVAAYPEASKKTLVTPLGPSVSPQEAPMPDFDGYALFVGTQEPRKNLARVISAYLNLAVAGKVSKRLVVVGNSGWGSTGNEADLVKLKALNMLEFRGTVNDEELRNAYSGAAYLVSPSLYEGFGMQIADALGYALPVIASDRSSMPEVLGRAGILVNPTEVTELQLAMETLSNDKHQWRVFSDEAKKQARKMDWRATAEATLETLISTPG